MKIDQLPLEMLMNIFSYLPSFGEISLTNKLFYSIICTMNDSNICLRINNQINFQWLQSIGKTNRKISKVLIRDLLVPRAEFEQRPINAIVEKFSTTIKSLKYVDVEMDESTFLKILMSIPNVEHLDVQCLRANRESPHKLHCTDDLNLKNLKSLAIDGIEYFGVLKRLPAGVLQELQVLNYDWNGLMSVINRQLNIKKLVIRCQQLYERRADDGDVPVPTDIFDKLRLESLEIEDPKLSSVTIAAIFSKLTELKSLIIPYEYNFDRPRVDDRIMNAIADLLQLETLGMDVSQTPDGSFVSIRKLKNLKDLRLQFSRMYNNCRAKLKILAESNNSSIITLTIGGYFKTSLDLFRTLAKSAPNLKQLKMIPGYYFEGTEEVDSVMTNFNFVEDLDMRFISAAPSDDQDDYFNPKLRKLSFTGRGPYKPWVTKFIASYPNLIKLILSLRPNDCHSNVQIRPIIDGFKKLESLTLNGCDMNIEDLNYLCEHKGSLKFVSVERLNVNVLTDELLKKMLANFNVVIVDVFSPCTIHRNDRMLHMAVDRYTMQSEREINLV